MFRAKFDEWLGRGIGLTCGFLIVALFLLGARSLYEWKTRPVPPAYTSKLCYSPALNRMICLGDPNECVKNSRPCTAEHHPADNSFRLWEYNYLHMHCFVHNDTLKHEPGDVCIHLQHLFEAPVDEAFEAHSFGDSTCPYLFPSCVKQSRGCIELIKGPDGGIFSIKETMSHPQCITCGKYLVQEQCDHGPNESVVISPSGQKAFALDFPWNPAENIKVFKNPPPPVKPTLQEELDKIAVGFIDIIKAMPIIIIEPHLDTITVTVTETVTVTHNVTVTENVLITKNVTVTEDVTRTSVLNETRTSERYPTEDTL